MRKLPRNICDYSDKDTEYCIQHLIDDYTIEELEKRIDIIRSQQDHAKNQVDKTAFNNLVLMELQHEIAIQRKTP